MVPVDEVGEVEEVEELDEVDELGEVDELDELEELAAAVPLVVSVVAGSAPPQARTRTAGASDLENRSMAHYGRSGPGAARPLIEVARRDMAVRA